MKRRDFLQGIAAFPVALVGSTAAPAAAVFRRVRPGDPSWPSDEQWSQLGKRVGGRLIRLLSPMETCRTDPSTCSELFKRLKNPYAIGDDPALTQTLGWVDAWTSAPSVYAVAAESSSDVIAAVNFAREHRLRLVVKGGGHSYQGTSCSADSLLIWTRRMDVIELHDDFVPRGGARAAQAQPAVSVGAGAIWLPVYQRVTTEAGRYVQGGGCGTVGVAGLIMSGGFGSFSKAYGLAAAALLEAEVVTADGAIRVVNQFSEDSDLFWALKGGGGGTFGVVTRLTLRTRDLPGLFGGVSGAIRAKSDAAYHRLVARVLDFYRDRLLNPHWGEQIRFQSGNVLRLAMVFQGTGIARRKPGSHSSTGSRCRLATFGGKSPCESLTFRRDASGMRRSSGSMRRRPSSPTIGRKRGTAIFSGLATAVTLDSTFTDTARPGCRPLCWRASGGKLWRMLSSRPADDGTCRCTSTKGSQARQPTRSNAPVIPQRIRMP